VEQQPAVVEPVSHLKEKMSSTFYEYLLNRPALLQAVANVLWHIGCVGLLAGALATSVDAILRVTISTTDGASVSYQQFMSGLPTFWIPESLLGVGAYLTLMLAAYLINDFVRELQRTLK